ncbi:nucleoside recognition protein [Niameybacter massiliensis]|uniref:Nucleoside recognition protein n=1 Tax=Holtiella tumoricola TaxID=3018743 RepID=A0AA42DRF7_9FIRM|nr:MULTISPECIES: nucleoside recognition domain-containing protein [Lachnospirales]MDA3733407.1 nucleoside recognition protein [Holtiella tumoricola]
MLNYLWGFMVIFSLLMALFGGNMQALTTSMLESSQSAVELCFKTCGALAMWMGIMRIAENAHLIDALAKKMTPILNFLFPDVPKDHPARKYIATNIIANFLGLGWAATPPGLKAMVELQKLNKTHPKTATHAMCMFLIVNISTIQLVSINMVAYRSAYGSANPTEVIGPSILATAVASIVAITFAKLMYRRND